MELPLMQGRSEKILPDDLFTCNYDDVSVTIQIGLFRKTSSRLEWFGFVELFFYCPLLPCAVDDKINIAWSKSIFG